MKTTDTGGPVKSERIKEKSSLASLDFWSYLKAFLSLVIVTLTGEILSPHNINLVNIALLYLLPVLVSAALWGRGPSFLAAILAVLAFDYFFVPPSFSFIPANPQDFFILAVFLIVAFVTGTLATNLRNELDKTRNREKRTLALYGLSRKIAAENDLQRILETFVEEIAETAEAEVSALVKDSHSDVLHKMAAYPADGTLSDNQEWATAHSALGEGENAEMSTEGRREVFLPIKMGEKTIGVFAIKLASGGANLPRDQVQLIEAFANLAAVAITRVKLAEEAEDQLRHSSEQLRALAGHLQSIREEERSNLARDIHDELGQALTGLKMDLSQLSRKPPEDQKLLAGQIKSMGKMIDDTIHVVRKICTQLRPGVLDDLGLVAAVEWQVQDFEKRTQIQCELSSSLEDSHLDRDLSTAIFRILQEALTNVLRHARATRVKIGIKNDGDFIVLTVEDNGRGITEREVSDAKSLGLLGIRERALLFGGEVQISGGSGRGTKVLVRVPPKQMEGYRAQDSRSR